ncbi:YgiT-type zinc finger protein [Nitrosomonas communis]|uniref:YgiT-type zinc finger domain-containing protein n=1 Tax=Nitrosomonas communis TaxID=44574 RepID=A0A1H2QV12_9PROT|nr:YgiT-type zinc finger protein [Nitrosomonas communis]SDW10758.1 YgiT-type zinc finger domain-containing protein [Nitrosomonas communis]
MPNQCAFCGNKNLTLKTTRYLHQHDEKLLIVEGVPCLECDFCGEQYFEIDILKRIEADHREIVEHRRQPTRYVSVAVEAFDSVR